MNSEEFGGIVGAQSCSTSVIRLRFFLERKGKFNDTSSQKLNEMIVNFIQINSKKLKIFRYL